MSSRTHPHPAALPEDQLLAHCDVQRTRGGGPGGQHRNKVETAIRIVHRPTALRGEASERRSQEQNRKMALFRLRLNLAIDVRGEITEPYAPSDLWQSRCSGGKIRVNLTHHDWPAILAEALDFLAVKQFDPKRAALLLDCTPSQLIKLIQREPRAWQWVNTQREKLGLHTLK